MADCVYKVELSKAAGLMVRLAKEIDYKNAILYQREREIEEKDKLLKSDIEGAGGIRRIRKQNLNNVTESQEIEFELQAQELVECKCEYEPELRNFMNNKLKGKMVCEIESSAQINASKKELEDALEYMESLNCALTVKERISNDELQDARKEAIKALQDLVTNRTMISIKRMGEVDWKPFHTMCKKKHSVGDWQEEAAKICSLWEEKVQNGHWHPFKRTEIGGTVQESIDEDDDELKALRNEWGMGAYKAITDALLELNKYNPSGGYLVPELWNSKKRRRASLKEVIEYMSKHMKTPKPRRI